MTGYMPFNLGPRKCIGAQTAMVELRVLLVAVLRNFRVALPPDAPADSKWTTGGAKLIPNLTLSPGGARVLLHPL